MTVSNLLCIVLYLFTVIYPLISKILHYTMPRMAHTSLFSKSVIRLLNVFGEPKVDTCLNIIQ